MEAQFKRGSEWRKWDLHVHTPESVLSNGFGNDWDIYVKRLFKKAISENIRAIGITDYFSLEGYKKLKNEYLSKPEKLKDLFSKEEIDYIKGILILPNIEFRLNKFVGSNRINFHVIFSNNISISEIEENFLHDVDFTFQGSPFTDDETRKLKLPNLCALGKRLQKEHSEFNNHPSELYTGMMNAVVDDSQICKILNSKPSLFHSKYLLVIPCDEDLSCISWNSQDHQARKVLIQKSNLLMASNPNTIEWGLGLKSENKEEFIKEFKSLKPCIFGSDAHNYDELFTKNKERQTWLKAELIFEGLLQVTNEPSRVFIGDCPDVLKRVKGNPTKYIKSLKVSKVKNSNITDIWFKDLFIELNPELVAIIGNKGKGKSALSDIIGLSANAHIDEKDFSFLNRDKFRNPRANFSKEFDATIYWEGGNPEIKNLSVNPDFDSPERAKYLPQSFLEKLCTSIDKEIFQEELEKVIFSRLEDYQKLGKGTLKEVLSERKKSLESELTQIINEISQKNIQIIDLERKDSVQYRKSISESLAAKENELVVHNEKKPTAKLPPNEDDESEKKTQAIIDEINANRKIIEGQEKVKEDLSKERSLLELDTNELNHLKQTFDSLSDYLKNTVESTSITFEKFNLKQEEVFKYSIDIKSIEEIINQKKDRLVTVQEYFITTNPANPQTIIDLAEKTINELQERLEGPTKEYQQYVSSFNDWQNARKKIIGSPDADDTVAYYQKINKYLEERIRDDLLKANEERINLVRRLLEVKIRMANLYKELYRPVSEFIDENKNELSDYNVNVDVALEINEFENKFFSFISNGAAGSFYGTIDSREVLKKISETVDFDDSPSVINWINDILIYLKFDKRQGQNNELKKELRPQLKGGFNEKDFYDFLFSMDYYEPSYQLKLGSKNLTELSPGERGALLLIFYLLLDKRDIPIVIDQPEENLDNQSVYNILVHFIKKAKQKRQIIIVTHNPNLAVVCDAEQIIRMDIAKDRRNEVSLITGGIEDQKINKAIVDILEGTRPAFNNRTDKYEVSNL